MAKLNIWCSPLTGKIYVGYVENGVGKSKIEVTQQAIEAVMGHMDMHKIDFECDAGELIFKPKAIDSPASPSETGAE